MSWLLFVRSKRSLLLFPASPPRKVFHSDIKRYRRWVGKWPAHNDTTSYSGNWPNGYYKIARSASFPDGFRTDHVNAWDPKYNTPWGEGQGAFEFVVRGRKNMQVHAGRWSGGTYCRGGYALWADELEEQGLLAPKVVPLSTAASMLTDCRTLGCIRTTEEAMALILNHHGKGKDPVEGIWVVDSVHNL